MATVAVTGASGFVGRALVRRLARSGHTVVALSRQVSEVACASRTVPIQSLTDPNGVAAGLKGCEIVVHLAARVHVMREQEPDPLRAFRQVNVAGTEVLLKAAQAEGLGRVLLVSSVKVHGEGGGRPLSAEDPAGFVDPYGQSKWEAEELVRGLPAQGPAWTIIRPPLVYGEGVGGNFLRLLSLASLSRRLPLPLGGIGNQRSLVWVENLVDGLAHVMMHPAAARQAYLISDQEDISTSQLIELLAQALGGRARLWPCPIRGLRVIGRLLGRQGEIDRLLGSLTVDSSPLTTDLGWKPPFDLREGLNRTAVWWQTQTQSA